MNEYSVVSLIAMIGWLILMGAGYSSYRVSGKNTVTMVLVWAAIFGAVALVFGLLI